MAHLNSLQSGIFTYLDMDTRVSTGTEDLAAYAALFVGATPGTADVLPGTAGQVATVDQHLRLPSVREFPSIGTPANIVNVPVYGQATSSQVQGQADAPSLEVTVNYVAEDMVKVHALVGKSIAFRFMMVDSACTLDDASNTALAAKQNTAFFFTGKIEAILVNPSLTDQTTATVTLSTQSDFLGPFTK
jgi:hypothetical protein